MEIKLIFWKYYKVVKNYYKNKFVVSGKDSVIFSSIYGNSLFFANEY